MTTTEPTEDRKVPSAPSASGPGVGRHLLDFISSLKLTVVFLVLGLLLVFIGTLAQVQEGLYNAQDRYFRSFLVFWGPAGASWRIPIFPGGYLIGTVLVVNLIAAHIRRFKFTWGKSGIFLTHFGLILLLLGQLATDMLSNESVMQIFEGEKKNYSENSRDSELVLIDTTNPEKDQVYSIPESWLSKPEIRDSRLPFTLRIKNYWPNASVFQEPPIKANIPPGAIKSTATAGLLREEYILPRAEATDMESRSIPVALVEVVGDKGSLGSFLVSAGLLVRQGFESGGKKYEIALRFARYYYPFNLTLMKATHEKYRGTEIPKNFASRVHLENPSNGDSRDTVIYMNNPLRYQGLTFFQFQMGADEMRMRPGDKRYTVLQVVRNPSWLAPYLSCILVGLGLTIQFMIHLVKFVSKRRTV